MSVRKRIKKIFIEWTYFVFSCNQACRHKSEWSGKHGSIRWLVNNEQGISFTALISHRQGNRQWASIKEIKKTVYVAFSRVKTLSVRNWKPMGKLVQLFLLLSRLMEFGIIYMLNPILPKLNKQSSHVSRPFWYSCKSRHLWMTSGYNTVYDESTTSRFDTVWIIWQLWHSTQGSSRRVCVPFWVRSAYTVGDS